MKKLIPAFAIILGWAMAGWAATPGTLASVRAIRALSKAEASQKLPVAFESTVTNFDRDLRNLYVQDGDEAIYVFAPKGVDVIPGDRILVRGTTQFVYNTMVDGDSVTLLRHGALPSPVRAGFEQLMTRNLDCRLVTVRATIRAADLALRPDVRANPNRPRMIYLQLLTDGGYIDAIVNSGDADALRGLLDAKAEVTGIRGGEFDGKSHLTGIILHVSSLTDVKILKRPSASPWSLPVTPMGEVMTAYLVRNLTRRIHVRGTITYYQPGYYRPGSAIVLQNGAESLWIESQTDEPLRIGDLVDVTGFPDVVDGSLALIHAEIRASPTRAPVTPLLVTWEQLANADTVGRHHYDLVSIEGRVVMSVREAVQDEYVLVADGKLFSAVLHHPDTVSRLPIPAMKQVQLGSRVRVTGICILMDSNPYTGETPFQILMRSADDIPVVAGPSWISVDKLLILIGLLLAIVFAVGARGWLIERKVRGKTAELAYIERRRSRILEEINGSVPLAEIIEHITELASFKLRGAPCWCQIADGALLGNYSPKLTALRIVRHEIPSRSGPPLGELFTAIDTLTKPSDLETETLSMAAELATLAIETRRLYSDMLHRSEFDLLTDIHNRFSLDKHMDALIDETRQKAGIFGLIYIDLDEFKLVNDLYGHQVGDLYLQEVALRMKRQLRSHDLLARLGGDEFAALVVPTARSHADVEEIAVRMERCFDEPFTVEGYVLLGSASIGLALYPEDGATKDSLLNAADAAMYAAKNAKRQIRAMPA
jgi:diguanylate cyclase (GGDEF)-like protein